MSRSLKVFGNNFVRRAASWMASFLALVSVSLSGRSGEAAANPIVLLDRDSLNVGHSGSSMQMSYLQVGMNKSDNQDWWPPLPE